MATICNGQVEPGGAVSSVRKSKSLTLTEAAILVERCVSYGSRIAAVFDS